MEYLIEQALVAGYTFNTADPFKGKRDYVANKPDPGTDEADDVRGYWTFNWGLCLSVQYDSMQVGPLFEAMVTGHKDDMPDEMIVKLHDLFDDLFLPRRKMTISEVVKLMEEIHGILTDSPVSQVHDEWVPLDNEENQQPGEEEEQ